MGGRGGGADHGAAQREGGDLAFSDLWPTEANGWSWLPNGLWAWVQVDSGLSQLLKTAASLVVPPAAGHKCHHGISPGSRQPQSQTSRAARRGGPSL